MHSHDILKSRIFENYIAYRECKNGFLSPSLLDDVLLYVFWMLYRNQKSNTSSNSHSCIWNERSELPVRQPVCGLAIGYVENVVTTREKAKAKQRLNTALLTNIPPICAVKFSPFLSIEKRLLSSPMDYYSFGIFYGGHVS